MTDVASAWGRRIRDYRVANGINQTELAHLLGIHQTTVSAFERGMAVPSPSTQRKIVDVCGLKPDDVYGIVTGAA